ncbi:MAG: N-acetylneuraminate synthase [Pseudomonadota bacterium]
MSEEFWLGRSGRALIIAEAGVNHNARRDLALALVDAATDAGADAVKFQTFDAKKLATGSAPKAAYQEARSDADSQLAMLQALELPREDLEAARDRAQERGVKFLSTPFDEASADMLAELGVEAFKISSGDLTHHQLLRHVASHAKPMIISTGMANLAEVEEAVDVIEAAGNPPLAILHCVSNYPAAPEQCNLAAMDTLDIAFARPVGWSDHTLGADISLAAVARGAAVVEKHFTTDKALPGPDHAMSLSPEELKDFIDRLRAVEAAIGDGVKRPTSPEADTRRAARRSLTAAVDIEPGAVITDDMLSAQRPGHGLAPKYHGVITGKRAARALKAGETLDWDCVMS